MILRTALFASLLASSAMAEPQGLLSPAMTALPTALWTQADLDETQKSLDSLPHIPLPNVAALSRTLILAQAEPPSTDRDDAFLSLRIDHLMTTGALEPAFAMVEGLGLTSPAQLTRMLDVALLTDQETVACPVFLRSDSPDLDWSARVFCLARSGDWQAAALTLETASGLSLITPSDANLLAHFLDPELDGTVARPDDVSPLRFALFDAIGEPLSTASLPLAYAHADLRSSAGWKLRLDAAERLGRHSALQANRLIHAYRDGRPAASGALWDRVRAVQAVDRALADPDADALDEALTPAWELLRPARLAGAFGSLWGPVLADRDTSSPAARRLILLSPAYATDGGGDVLNWVATGNGPTPEATDRSARAVIAALSDAEPPEHLMRLQAEQGLGPAVLAALAEIEAGRDGGTVSLRGGLAFLRKAGRVTDARRIALDHLILDRGL